MYCIYIYAPIYIYIYTQPNLMREDDCTDMFVDNFLFMAEQLRNVSAMDAVCALHHISTSGLLALGYIVMYIYILTYVYIYIYIMCMYIHDYACIYIYIHNYVYIQLCIVYIYMHLSIYIYTQPNLMRGDDCTDMFVDNFLFMAEQLRNVSAVDAVCALHHISTSGLLTLGYIVMYIHDYAYVI